VKDDAENNVRNAPPHENIELHRDEGIPVDVDHPDVPFQRDHPLLAEARILGVEKRWDLVGRLPPADA